MNHILTLTDFSKVSDHAVKAAFVFAAKNKSSLTIYHNEDGTNLNSYDLSDTSDCTQLLADYADHATLLNEWIALAKKYDIAAKNLVGPHDFISEIKQLNEKLEVDMIVMGSTGAGGKVEYFWGSNTEKVVKKVDCPVLVIKSPMQDYVMDNIVFASSFDTSEKEILKYALELLNPPPHAVIHLLSIDTSSYFSQPTALMREVMKDFEELVKPFKAVSHFHKDYSVDAGIRHFIEDVKPDVLVMNNKDEKPLKRFLQGSNTLRAVNHSDFPVLTIDFK